jgi:NADH:ubiquinone oxidoreductase subunit 6 (subunit J)
VTAAIFYIAGLLALGTAVSVILQRNPFLAAFSLILHFATLAVLYLDLQADFVAAAQVLVYAGGVMILFIFALAYLGERAELDLRRSRFGGWFAIVASVAIFLEVAIAVTRSNGLLDTPASVGDGFGSPSAIGRVFFTNYLLAFEVVSLVLLVGAVAGVVLGAGPLRQATQSRGFERRDVGDTAGPRPSEDVTSGTGAPT